MGDSRDWKVFTPPSLLEAVQHLRKNFDQAAWNYRTVTRQLCFAALHPGKHDKFLADYQRPFAHYRRLFSVGASASFDQMIAIRTPPSLFAAYFHGFAHCMQLHVRITFFELFQVANANAGTLQVHPAEWARNHVRILIAAQFRPVRRWIKEVCDEQMLTVESADNFEEVVFWKTWRAPRLIYMRPSGNLPFNSDDAWKREDQEHTERLLNSLAGDFIQRLETRLEEIVGQLYVSLAKRKATGATTENRPTPQSTTELVTPSTKSHSSGGTGKPKDVIEKPRTKKTDLSAMFDAADLTERQRECLSLLFEYSMRKTDVARYLGLDRKTVDEHLAAGTRRMEASRAKLRGDRSFAKSKAGEKRDGTREG